MKASIVTRITIDSSPAEVFDYLTNYKYYRLWNPQIIETSRFTKLTLHSTYATTSQVLGVTIKSQNIVTKFRSNTFIRIENNTGLVHYVADFSLVTQASKTVVTCSTTVSSKSKAFAFTAPVMKRLAQRELQTDMQALKLACENKLLQ